MSNGLGVNTLPNYVYKHRTRGLPRCRFEARVSASKNRATTISKRKAIALAADLAIAGGGADRLLSQATPINFLEKMESSSQKKLWRDSLRMCFGTSSVGKKAAKLHDDIMCLSRGLKPSVLLDYLKPDPTALQQFLLSLGRHDSVLSKMAILMVNGDVFLMHKPGWSRILERTAIKVVDVSNNSGHISLPSEEFSVRIKQHMRDWLDRGVPSLSESGETCPIVVERHSCPVNLCSLYGWLVGYPTVYWFEEGSGHSLDCMELNLWTVLARNVSGTSLNPQKQERLWQNVRLRMSKYMVVQVSCQCLHEHC